MEPRIQYAQTTDGVSIAYWTLGESASPLVVMPWIPWSHIQLQWQSMATRRWYQRLSQKRGVVTYDGRGSGLSERAVSDFSLEANLLDLEAVVDRLGLGQFPLFGFGDSGAVAIAYAARHPERVSHLILWSSYSRASDWLQTIRGKAVSALRVSGDWELYTETLARVSLGKMPEKQAGRAVAFMKQCASPETVLAAYQAIDEFDVTELLPQVTSPTLVLYAHGWQKLFQEDTPSRLVSRIPDARLAVIDAVPARPYLGDTELLAGAIDEFVAPRKHAKSKKPKPAKQKKRKAATSTGLATILFTDMEGSTALTQRLGDAKAQELRRTHDSIVRDALRAKGGSETKHTGDGIMASFPSASRAIECAVAVQRAIAEQSETPLRVRIGLNAGEPVAEESDLFGTAVNLAKRICDQAEPGQILVSDVVQQLAAGKGFTFADKGEATLKGFEKPVRLHEVVWD